MAHDRRHDTALNEWRADRRSRLFWAFSGMQKDFNTLRALHVTRDVVRVTALRPGAVKKRIERCPDGPQIVTRFLP
jgi:hypothetical protein